LIEIREEIKQGKKKKSFLNQRGLKHSIKGGGGEIAA